MKKARGLGRIFRPLYPPPGQSYKAARAAGTLREAAVWWISYYRGKERRESSHSTNRADAVRLLNKRRGEIAQGDWIGPVADKTSLDELLAMVKTDRQMNGRASDHLPAYERRLLAFFGLGCRAVNLTADRIDQYTAARLAESAAPATINRELAALRRGFRLGYRAGKVRRVPPFGLLREQNTRTGFFEEPEFRAVLGHLPGELQPVAEFAYLTGWRRGEVLGLQWRNIDFTAGTVRLEPGTTKNDEGRTFPFSALPALADLLRRQRESTMAVERATGQIIPAVFHRDGRPIRHFRRAWLTACAAAGLPGRLFHDFRRTVVRNLERAGVARSVAMKLTGHKTESVYRRYAIVAEADLSVGVAKLAALHAAEAGSSVRVIALPTPDGGRPRPRPGRPGSRQELAKSVTPNEAAGATPAR